MGAVLELRGNYIRCSGVQRLGLAWNSIGNAGAIRLAQAACKMSALVDLDLAYNQIGDDGAVRFACVVEISSSLKQLDLRSNHVRTHGHGSSLLKDACGERVLLHLEGDGGVPISDVLVDPKDPTPEKGPVGKRRVLVRLNSSPLNHKGRNVL